MSASPQSHVHHYVPRWYQRRFLKTGQFKFYYLDLRPETVVSNGRSYQRRDLLCWGPDRCFYKNDLYTLTLGNWTTDDFEKRFFGTIDNNGRLAVELFGNFNGLSKCFSKNPEGKGVREAFQALPQYMDAQRFRTPRGLDFLKSVINANDRNETLVAMRHLYRFHTTMWSEGVWEIVRARLSPTKFIVTDEPVTFFNRRAFPSELVYPKDVGLEQVGTRTLFPLGLDACLVITHLQLVRNPWTNPTASRVNARSYKQTMFSMLDTQFGRELEQDEVLRLNYILKRRATRYIAAAEEEWLYPERYVSTTNWAKLDDDWFLLPHLYKVPFHGEIMVGWNDGTSWAMDEYGRNPRDPKYRDPKLHEEEWIRHQEAEREWAKKRAGKSVAHVDEFRHDDVYDKMMEERLAKGAKA
ncbi:MAG TPA: hypothetical protein VK805_19245 [Candidatus Baltobacteraceae bacterium]|nr:hypothetical protein [Candidatus Baltobacteraceae bacterium]